MLDPARQRAEQRVQRFLDAALELLIASGGDFTLQDVVERAGLSLRSFYQHFAGKHELLLAVLEDAVRRAEEQLRAKVEAVDDPLERLHRLVVEYYLSGSQTRRMEGTSPALWHVGQSLLADHSLEVGYAFQPLQALFAEVLDNAIQAGAVRSEGRLGLRSVFLFRAIGFAAFVANAQSTFTTAKDASAAAEDLWDLLFNGLRTD